MLIRAIVLSVVVGACATEAEPCAAPKTSCSTAVDRYYEAGCTYYVEAAGESVPMPHDVMVGVCESVSAAREGCRREMDAWLVCNAQVGIPDCGCVAELAAVLWCR